MNKIFCPASWRGNSLSTGFRRLPPFRTIKFIPQMPIHKERTKLDMPNKNLIRAVVLAALCVWPGVEMYRLYAAKQDLAARLQVESRVNLRLAMTRQKTQFA